MCGEGGDLSRMSSPELCRDSKRDKASNDDAAESSSSAEHGPSCAGAFRSDCHIHVMLEDEYYGLNYAYYTLGHTDLQSVQLSSRRHVHVSLASDVGAAQNNPRIMLASMHRASVQTTKKSWL